MGKEQKQDNGGVLSEFNNITFGECRATRHIYGQEELKVVWSFNIISKVYGKSELLRWDLIQWIHGMNNAESH